MRSIDFNQQLQILCCVLDRKLPPPAGMHANLSVLPVAADQTGNLRQADSRHLRQERAHHTALFLPQPKILLLHQYRLDPRVLLDPALGDKIDSSTAAEKLRHPLRGQTFQFLHANQHPPGMVADPNISGSFWFGNGSPFRIILYWTILSTTARFRYDRLMDAHPAASARRYCI